MTEEVGARFCTQWLELSDQLGVFLPRGLALDLLDAYWAPERHYHEVRHVVFLLDEIDRRTGLIEDPRMLKLAAYFHDAVYDPLARDNEERSAAWALQALSKARYPRAEAVASLILKTKSHHSGDASPDEALFLDMDFAILGAPRDIYATYADNIRAEYAAVPEDRFRAGRAAFLKGVLAQPRMFRTDLYEQEFGAQARENLAWEIARLTAP